MNLKKALLFTAIMCATALAQRPVVELLYDDNVVNYGSSEGIGEVLTVSSVTPIFSAGGMDDSKCLDITSASSMGSSGGLVRFLSTSKVANDLTCLRSFTITGWMKSSTPIASLAGITAFAGADAGFRLRCYSNNRLRLMLDTPDTDTQYFYSSTQANYSCTDWKFFAVVYDGTISTDNVRFYYSTALGQPLLLDSVQSYGGGTIFMDPAIFYIGNVNTSGTSVFDGLLDSVRVFGSKSDASAALNEQQISVWKEKNTLEPISLATIDLRFEDNLVSEGRFTDIAYMRDYNGTLPKYVSGGIGGGKCLDMTVATGMGARGPFLGFTETYGVNDYVYSTKAITITCWLKSPVVPNNGARIFSYLDTSGRGMELYFASPGRLSLNIGPFVYQSSVAANYTCLDWTFVAVTFDGVQTANNVKFYYGANDGTGQVLLDSTFTTTLRQLLGDKTSVNIANRGTVYPFDGFVDSFKVFTSKDNAVAALTASQLSSVKIDNQTTVVPAVVDNEFRKSDVALMRTSSALPTDGYGATRIVWNYDTHQGIVDSFAALGIAASQTHNFETTSYNGSLDFLNGKYYTNDPTMPSRARDIEGNLVEKNADPPGQYYPSVSSQAFWDDTAGRLVDVLLPLNPYTVQYDTPAGDRHAMSLGYPVGFDDSTLAGFRDYLDAKYTPSQLYTLFDIDNIVSFNYKTYLADKYGITTTAAYKSQRDSIDLTTELEYYLEANNVDVIDGLRQLVNASPRNAKISGNCGIFRTYGRVLIPVLDFHTAELPKAKVLGVLDSRDSVVCSIAEALDMPYYGVNNCDVTAYLMDNSKTNYMKCLIAAVYANGGVMQAPWNIWAGGDIRYYGSWDIYGAFFQFVRAYAAWFDDYKPQSQLAILWNCDNEIDELYNIAQTVYDMNIPFDVLPLGDKYPYSRIDVDAVAAKYQQVVMASSYNTFSAENLATINDLATKITIAGNATQISLANDWIETTGDAIPTTWILPRKNAAKSGSDIVLHILNRSYSAATDDVNLAGMNIKLHNDIFDGLVVKDVQWTGPQTPQTQLAFIQTADGISIDIPKTPIWSMLKVSVYSAADIDTNGVVDLEDFAMFAQSWSDCYGQQTCINNDADLNKDGMVTIEDLYQFSGLWIQ